MKRSTSIPLYAITVFIGAFLLFQVQPLIGKYILPWFGGSPEVWTTCLLFFQVLLLGGYAYAHLVVRYLGPRAQVIVHVAVITAALAMLPITPAAAWKPEGPDYPTLHILLLLSVCIGLPYFVLSATGPLMQGWFSRTHPGTSPYRLYALSNAGSLLALVSYPFLIEPALSRPIQANVWSWGLGGFALLAGACAAVLWKTHTKSRQASPEEANPPERPPTLGVRLLWLALPAAASVELLAVTNKICLDVAAVPFLWILPLCLYLLSFIICFNHERWYVRPVFLSVFILSIVVVAMVRALAVDLTAIQQILMYSVVLLACCMVCHGELFRLRPHPRRLTGYYLMIAAGGACGGFFVAVVAPLLFDTYLELHMGLLASCLFVLLADRREKDFEALRQRGGKKKSAPKKAPAPFSRRWVWMGLIIVVGVAAIFAEGHRGDADKVAVLTSRNFFGVVTLWENNRHDPLKHQFVLQHGTTFHGLQFVDPEKRRSPTTYYSRTSGGGLTMHFFPRKSNRRIGVVGLGVGTMATYGKSGDWFCFYEINPEIDRLARTRFSYLSDCEGEVDVVMGDARLSMERQPPQEFDILILDAFTSDAVPVHLLTKEAFEIYLRHLKSDGVIAVHVSTLHLDLQSVVWRLGRHFNLKTAWIKNDVNEAAGILASDWILLTNNEEFLNTPAMREAFSSPQNDLGQVDLWTDDRVNLLQILK